MHLLSLVIAVISTPDTVRLVLRTFTSQPVTLASPTWGWLGLDTARLMPFTLVDMNFVCTALVSTGQVKGGRADYWMQVRTGHILASLHSLATPPHEPCTTFPVYCCTYSTPFPTDSKGTFSLGEQLTVHSLGTRIRSSNLSHCSRPWARW